MGKFSFPGFHPAGLIAFKTDQKRILVYPGLRFEFWWHLSQSK